MCDLGSSQGNKNGERMGLWDFVGCVCDQDSPIMMIGNNMIAVEGEKRGKFIVSQKVRDFHFFLLEAGLCDFGFLGIKYMSCNRHSFLRIWDRLDWVMCTKVGWICILLWFIPLLGLYLTIVCCCLILRKVISVEQNLFILNVCGCISHIPSRSLERARRQMFMGHLRISLHSRIRKQKRFYDNKIRRKLVAYSGRVNYFKLKSSICKPRKLI